MKRSCPSEYETLIKVPDGDVSVAYQHFVEIFYPNKGSMGMHFWAFIGCNKPPLANPSVRYWELPEKAAHYVNLLKGPHYKAIAKAMVLNGHQYKEALE